jgi:S1-C subfamily serine protease
MITSNVLRRVFHIAYQGSTATGFTLDIDEKQYLVTASHVLGNNPNDVISLSIMHNEQWHPVQARLVGNAPYDSDIAVLSLPQILTNCGNPLPIAEECSLSQEAYFLGYPLGTGMQLGAVHNFYPMPFVKRAIVSAFNTGGRPLMYYLDGINNPGFSGGPVVVRDPKTREFQVLAVISGYRMVHRPIHYNGETVTGLVFGENSGIINSVGVLHARDLARANPIGFPLS